MRRIAFGLGSILILAVFAVVLSSRGTAQERAKSTDEIPPGAVLLEPRVPDLSPGAKLFDGKSVALTTPSRSHLLKNVEWQHIGNYYYFVGKPFDEKGAVRPGETVWVRQDTITDITVWDDLKKAEK